MVRVFGRNGDTNVKEGRAERMGGERKPVDRGRVHTVCISTATANRMSVSIQLCLPPVFSSPGARYTSLQDNTLKLRRRLWTWIQRFLRPQASDLRRDFTGIPANSDLGQ